jgi:hypothetical protein
VNTARAADRNRGARVFDRGVLDRTPVAKPASKTRRQLKATETMSVASAARAPLDCAAAAADTAAPPPALRRSDSDCEHRNDLAGSSSTGGHVSFQSPAAAPTPRSGLSRKYSGVQGFAFNMLQTMTNSDSNASSLSLSIELRCECYFNFFYNGHIVFRFFLLSFSFLYPCCTCLLLIDFFRIRVFHPSSFFLCLSLSALAI